MITRWDERVSCKTHKDGVTTGNFFRCQSWRRKACRSWCAVCAVSLSFNCRLSGYARERAARSQQSDRAAGSFVVISWKWRGVSARYLSFNKIRLLRRLCSKVSLCSRLIHTSYSSCSLWAIVRNHLSTWSAIMRCKWLRFLDSGSSIVFRHDISVICETSSASSRTLLDASTYEYFSKSLIRKYLRKYTLM